MAMRKHPVIFGISLTLLIGALFLILLYGLNFATGNVASFSKANKIGVVTISGIISSSQEVVEQLEEFENDDNIKAVVIRIDSPGGDRKSVV
jgi:protease-4